MNAPPVIMKETPKKEMKYGKTEAFEIENKYNLKISFNDKIIFFEIEEKDKFPKQDFNIFLNLEELGNINRYFYQFESLKEVYETLKKLIEQNSLFVVKEDKLMKIKIENPINDKVIYINVPLKEKDLKNELESIVSYISTLNNRINELEKKVDEINELKNKFKIFEDYLPYLNQMKLEIDNKKEQQKKNENNFWEGFKNSNIANIEEQKAIYNWLDKRPKNAKLLLNSKNDGDKISTFYEKCKDKSPTLVLVKTTEGKKFGGYTSISWKNNNGGKITDYQSFIFSLDKMKKYEVQKPEKAIQTNDDYFAFGAGNCDIYIVDNCHSENSCDSRDNYGISGNKLAGNETFKVSSYEVYYLEEK